MKNSKRWFVILVALVLVVTSMSALVGCQTKKEESSKQEPPTEEAKNTPTETDTTDDNAESDTEEDKETAAGQESAYPLDTAETLSIWSSTLQPATAYTDYTESPFHTNLAEKTGVQMEWRFPTAGVGSGEAFNLMLASDDYPDIIYHPVSSEADRLITEGILRDLSEEMPVHAPSHWALLQGNEHFNKSAKTDQGMYYGFGSYRESPWAAAYTGPLVRQDWLDEQALELPRTVEELEKVLRVFKDEYGAMLAFNPGRMNFVFPSGFGAYGTFAPQYFVDDNHKVQLAQAQPEWKELITTLSGWYGEGLIDPDAITMDDDAVRTKVINDKVGYSGTALSQMSLWIDDVETMGSGAKWVGSPYLRTTVDAPVKWLQTEDMVSVYQATVTTACSDEKLPVALRWLDYGYTEEGHVFWNFGKEGESYTMENGQPTFTELVTKDPEGVSIAVSKYIGSHGSAIGVQAEGMVRQRMATEAVAANDVWQENNVAMEHILPVGVSFTNEESNEIGMLASSVNTYISENAFLFLTGERPLDQLDAFVIEMEEMGLPRLLEIHQDAYDRFLAR